MADRVGIRIELQGDKQALASLREIQSIVNNLAGRKINFSVNGSAFDNILDTVRDIQSGVSELTQKMDTFSDSAAPASMHMQELNDLIGDASHNAGNLLDVFNSVGDVLSSLNDAAYDFAGAIGDAFSGMSSVFDFDALSTVTDTLVTEGTKALVGDLDKMRSRFDIMSTFIDYMNLAGASTQDSEEALARINQSILGLPIGLDESAYRLRRYQMFLGDVDKSTNLVIGLQKAIMAGGANEQMRNMAYTQIDRLLAAGKLSTSRQWLSLIQGLGVSMNFITEEMGVTGLTVNQFADQLSKGKIPAKDFLEALMRLGAGGSAASDKLDKALEIYKGTLESWLSNIQFAATRGGVVVMDALEDTLKVLGKEEGMVSILREVRDSINDFYKALGGYVSERPDGLLRILEYVDKIRERWSKFNWRGTADKIFENMGKMIDIVIDVYDKLPPGAIEEFISFATTWAGPIGKIMSAIQDGGVWMIAVFKRFKDYDFARLADKVLTSLGKAVDKVVWFLELIPDSVMDDIITFGLVWAPLLKKALPIIFGVVGTLIAGLRVFRGISIGSSLGRLTELLGGAKTMFTTLGGVAALVAIIAGVGAVVYEFVVIADKVSKMNFGPNLESNLQRLGDAFVGLAVLVGGISVFLVAINSASGGGAGLALAIGELLTGGLIALIGEAGWAIGSLVEVAIKVAEHPMPSEERIKSVETVLGSLYSTISAVSLNFANIDSKNLEKMASSIDSVVALAESFEAIEYLANNRINYNAIGERMSGLIRAYNDVYNEMHKMFVDPNGTYGQMYAKYQDASGINSLLEYIAKMPGLIKDVFVSMVDADNAIRGALGGEVGVGATNIWTLDPLKQRLEQVLTSIGEIYAFIVEEFDPNGDGPANASVAALAAEYMKETMRNLNSTIGIFMDTGDHMGSESYVDDMTGWMLIGSTFEANARAVKEDMIVAIGYIGEIFEAIDNLAIAWNTENKGKQLESVMSNLRSGVDSLIGIYQAVKTAFPENSTYYGLMEAGSYAAQGVKSIADAINRSDIAFMKQEQVGWGMFNTNTRILQEIMANLREMFISIQSLGAWSKLVLENGIPWQVYSILSTMNSALKEIPEDAESRLEKARLLSEAMGYVSEMIKTLWGMQEEVNNITNNKKGQKTVVQKIGDIYDGIARALGVAYNGDTAQKIKLLNGTIQNINEALYTLTNFNLKTLADNFEYYFEKVKKFDDLLAKDLKQHLADDKKGFAELKDKVNELNAVLGATATLQYLQTYDYWLNQIGSTAQRAKGHINDLALAAINMPKVSSFTTQPVATKYVKGANNAVPYATGGFIFRPMGTDTVPAMLTPGEFVMRRKAVNAFGKEFMANINRLNIPGALESLMRRVHSPQSFAANINASRTYDNHAVVNQTIVTNNPNYTYRRASRWVGAL